MTKKKGRDLLREDNVTYGDYAEFDDGNRYELVDGRLELMSPGPNSVHQLVSSEIQKRISDTCMQDAIVLYAPIDVILSDREVRQPDLVILLRAHIHRLAKYGIEGPPDIVVEILSPSTAKRDKQSKMASYARHSIPEYWIVDPSHYFLEQYLLDAQSQAYTLADIYAQDDIIASPTLSCIHFSMQEIANSLPEALR